MATGSQSVLIRGVVTRIFESGSGHGVEFSAFLGGRKRIFFVNQQVFSVGQWVEVWFWRGVVRTIRVRGRLFFMEEIGVREG